MVKTLLSGFKRGLKQVKEKPQLAYTIFTAIVIFFAFLLVSNNFFVIAKDSYDRLINIRAGAIHDVFEEFALEYIDNPEQLSSKITNISSKNQTIIDFRVISFQDNERIIVSSLNKEQEGLVDLENDYLYRLAVVNPEHSLTSEEIKNNERFFNTARAITDNEGAVVGLIYTKQSLSEADQKISESIMNGIVLLIIVLIFIMLLFFRHAKIIDYAVLYTRLKELDKMKDDFISIATHELRTPLTVIRGYIEMLKSEKDLNEGKQYIENIDIHSKRLSELIDDILYVPKIEQGRMDFVFEKFNPEQEIKDTVVFLSQIASEKKLKLEYEIIETAEILADKKIFRQILTNIIGNSIKYTEEGGITVKSSVKNNQLTVRIEDTGIGMTADEQKGLFQKFYRIRSKETEDITGTGLGLWITAKFLEKMKGSIAIESIKGVGTHVTINFPVAD